MATPKPHKPLPVMPPNSVWVKPNCRPQSSRMPLRMEHPTPAAMSVMKLARNSRRWPAVMGFAGVLTNSGDFFGFRSDSFDVDLFVASDRAEIKDQQEVSSRHGQGHEG